MILMLVAILTATSVTQGSMLNLTLLEPAHVSLNECMYFYNTMTSEANLSEGSYDVVVTHKCEGVVEIDVEGLKSGEKQKLEVEVAKVENPDEELKKLDDVIFQLRKDLKSSKDRISSLEKLVDTLNSMNVELYDRLRQYRKTMEELKLKLKNESSANKRCGALVAKLNETIKDLSEKISDIENENVKLRGEVSRLSSMLSSNITFAETFKILFFFVLSFLIGTYFSMLRK